jgi:hypothetical protein
MVDFGRRKLTGEIVEDRGPIGVGGRHLFGVNIFMDPFDPMSVELPEDEMEAAPPESQANASIEKQRVIDYLINGGLISILWSGTQGGKRGQVWICLDQLGNVTHTFIPERSTRGGLVAPFGAVWDGKIFRDKRDEVEAFLESFGLNREESKFVISKVGTAP